MLLFSLLYGIISYTFSYYGEMITYLGMTMPRAVFSLVSWLRHPYNGKRSEVRIQRIRKKERIFMLTLTLAVTVAFYFLLRYFHTAHLLPSTISVTTSFLAVYLTFRRSPWFSLAYSFGRWQLQQTGAIFPWWFVFPRFASMTFTVFSAGKSGSSGNGRRAEKHKTARPFPARTPLSCSRGLPK